MVASNEEQISDYKEAFSLYDKKGTGTVDVSAIGDLLRALGQNPTQAEIHKFTTTITEPITFDYFVSDVLKPNENTGADPHGTVDEFIQGFQVFDKDGSGLISSAELRYVLTTLGEKLSNEEVDELLKCVETQKSGLINYEEFVKMVMAG